MVNWLLGKRTIITKPFSKFFLKIHRQAFLLKYLRYLKTTIMMQVSKINLFEWICKSIHLNARESEWKWLMQFIQLCNWMQVNTTMILCVSKWIHWNARDSRKQHWMQVKAGNQSECNWIERNPSKYNYV